MNKQTKFQAFYPENDMHASPMIFDSYEKICIHWENRGWEEINSTGQNDLTAFINAVTGDIVVIRRIE